MFLFTLVLGVLFLPEADNLKCKCETGPYGNCSEETTECSSQYDRCSVATEVTVEGDTMFSEHNYTGCIMSELCLDYSANYGVHRVVQKSSCCSGDLCKAKLDSRNTKLEFNLFPNGRKCYTCADEKCMTTLNCAWNENYCFKVTGNVQGVTLAMKGCASELFCSDVAVSLVNQFTSVVNNFISLMNQFTLQGNQFTSHGNQFTGPKLSCCQGDYCNSASSTSPTLLLLLVPLLFSALFS